MGGTAEQGKSNKKQYTLIAGLRVKQTIFRKQFCKLQNKLV